MPIGRAGRGCLTVVRIDHSGEPDDVQEATCRLPAVLIGTLVLVRDPDPIRRRTIGQSMMEPR